MDSGHLLTIGYDADDTVWFSGSGPVAGWLNTRLFDETGDAVKAQGWAPWVLDTNGNGKVDEYTDPGKPAEAGKDMRIAGSGPYAVMPHPTDGSVWYTFNVFAGTAMNRRLQWQYAVLLQRSPFGHVDQAIAQRRRRAPLAVSRAHQVVGRRPAGAEIVIVGDTPADVTCGASVGARAIGVATGSYSAEELTAVGAYAAFDDLSDLDAVWEAIWS